MIRTYQDAQRESAYLQAAFYEELVSRRREAGLVLTPYEIALEAAAKELRETQERYDGLAKRRAQIQGAIAGLRHHLSTEYPDAAEVLETAEHEYENNLTGGKKS